MRGAEVFINLLSFDQTGKKFFFKKGCSRKRKKVLFSLKNVVKQS